MNLNFTSELELNEDCWKKSLQNFLCNFIYERMFGKTLLWFLDWTKKWMIVGGWYVLLCLWCNSYIALQVDS